MILLIDNYDSFSYNLYQAVGAVNPEIRVIRNNELSPEEIEALRPTHMILSPGPGRPADAGVCEEVVKRMAGKAAILGVCLGHQAICEAFGATITYAKELMHGKQSRIYIANGSALFQGLPPLIEGARYHSLCADRSTLPDELLVIAETDEGEVMGVKHAEFDLYGVQFHPESVLTPLGERIIGNFLRIGGKQNDSECDL